MTNQELAKMARTFGHKTSDIVLAATRDEAHRTESTQAVNTDDSLVHQVRRPPFRAPGKRYGSYSKPDDPRNKKTRFDSRRLSQKQERCSRCNKWMHKNRPCPALRLKCHECGSFGHFAVVCKKKRVNAIVDQTPQEAGLEPKEEEVK